MGEVLRITKRLNYLEDQLKQIQPVKSAAELENVAAVELSVIEELKKEVELLKLNNSPSYDFDALRNELTSLKEHYIVLQMKVEQLELSTSAMLDRVLTLKEKIEPNMALNLLEARVMSLEERYAVREVVGIGSS
jgi:predicted  nucleic acid-binding Zn-ribbon protein